MRTSVIPLMRRRDDGETFLFFSSQQLPVALGRGGRWGMGGEEEGEKIQRKESRRERKGRRQEGWMGEQQEEINMKNMRH